MTKISKATMINETQGIAVIPTTQSFATTNIFAVCRGVDYFMSKTVN